jgi:hypothetical protein
VLDVLFGRLETSPATWKYECTIVICCAASKLPNCPCILKSGVLSLLEDFDLRVELVEGGLIPTVPSRLNYLLWIRDIVQVSTYGFSLSAFYLPGY